MNGFDRLVMTRKIYFVNLSRTDIFVFFFYCGICKSDFG